MGWLKTKHLHPIRLRHGGVVLNSDFKMVIHGTFLVLHLYMISVWGSAVLLSIMLHLVVVFFQQLASPSGYKVCQFCKEHIKKDATVCRFCSRDV